MPESPPDVATAVIDGIGSLTTPSAETAARDIDPDLITEWMRRHLDILVVEFRKACQAIGDHIPAAGDDLLPFQHEVSLEFSSEVPGEAHLNRRAVKLTVAPFDGHDDAETYTGPEWTPERLREHLAATVRENAALGDQLDNLAAYLGERYGRPWRTFRETNAAYIVTMTIQLLDDVAKTDERLQAISRQLVDIGKALPADVLRQADADTRGHDWSGDMVALDAIAPAAIAHLTAAGQQLAALTARYNLAEAVLAGIADVGSPSLDRLIEGIARSYRGVEFDAGERLPEELAIRVACRKYGVIPVPSTTITPRSVKGCNVEDTPQGRVVQADSPVVPA